MILKIIIPLWAPLKNLFERLFGNAKRISLGFLFKMSKIFAAKLEITGQSMSADYWVL